MNSLGAEFVRTALQFREKSENSLLCVQVLHKALSFVISHCSCAQNGSIRSFFLFLTCQIGTARQNERLMVDYIKLVADLKGF